MMSAPIAAANCWTGRSGHLICLEKIQPRLSGSIRASCDHCAHIGDRWLRQWWLGRHTGGHPDRYDAGRPCDDRHNRHYGAEHAECARRPCRSHEYGNRSEEHTSELQSLMRISYAVFCLKKKKNTEYTKW